ncbi:reverse transcriptase domain-containing protein [Trichonephila inaurata madagascariensis]|uniref:Reverse transcriptase domain-containing protein n=1 Tax=Trichonephila inaurata madagascariensis TaxID=2747483 RepID=A0A8X6WMY7_9ARAC|nr:reverse transcriptase domain-containing protein [Trichonephila inaurata madagascariensis]
MNLDLVIEDHFSYLGATFDNMHSCREYTEENTKKGVKRLSLLKRLAGVTWGSCPEFRITTYKSYVRHVLEYGEELLDTSSKSCGDIIDMIQNKALSLKHLCCLFHSH